MIKRIFAAILATASIVAADAQPALAGDFTAVLNNAPAGKTLTSGLTVNALGSQAQLSPCLTQLDSFGLRCVGQSKTAATAQVAEVASGSQAYCSGLQVGDKIVALQANQDSFILNISRQGKLYSVTLRSAEPTLEPPPRKTSAKLAAATDVLYSKYNPLLNGTMDDHAIHGQVNDFSWPLHGGVEQHPFSMREIASVGHDGVMQCAVRNCWFESSLAALADTPDGPAVIAKMITLSPEGYKVKFPGLDTAVEVKEREITAAHIVDPAKWAAVLDRAEMKVYPNNYPCWGAGPNGLNIGLDMLTGKPITCVTLKNVTRSQLSELLARLRLQRQPIIASSVLRSDDQAAILPVTPGHAYSVVDYDRTAGMITLRNPYGREDAPGAGLVQNLTRDEIRLDIQTFMKYFRQISFPG